MSWCNKLASTPVIGLKLDWHFASGNKILDCLSPIIRKMNIGDVAAFGINTLDSSSVVFTTNEGFQYSANANSISVGFTHRGKVRSTAGGLLTLELSSIAKPYTELLETASRKLVEAALLLPSSKQREFFRIGIISNTLVEEADFPPGFSKMVEYFGRPWQQGMEYYQIQTTAGLTSSPTWSDRCIHKIAKVEDPDGVPSLHFDWQRNFKAGHALSEQTLKSEMVAASKAALAYFEALAEGNMFDDDLLANKKPE